MYQGSDSPPGASASSSAPQTCSHGDACPGGTKAGAEAGWGWQKPQRLRWLSQHSLWGSSRWCLPPPLLTSKDTAQGHLVS